MEVYILSMDKLESGKFGGKSSSASAYRIYKDVKLDYITPKHIGFSVPDQKYGTEHSVIYYGEKKFPKSWNCDCKWYSLKQKFCKHILAVFLRLIRDEAFLKNVKRTQI